MVGRQRFSTCGPLEGSGDMPSLENFGNSGPLRAILVHFRIITFNYTHWKQMPPQLLRRGRFWQLPPPNDTLYGDVSSAVKREIASMKPAKRYRGRKRRIHKEMDKLIVACCKKAGLKLNQWFQCPYIWCILVTCVFLNRSHPTIFCVLLPYNEICFHAEMIILHAVYVQHS